MADFNCTSCVVGIVLVLGGLLTVILVPISFGDVEYDQVRTYNIEGILFSLIVLFIVSSLDYISWPIFAFILTILLSYILLFYLQDTGNIWSKLQSIDVLLKP